MYRVKELDEFIETYSGLRKDSTSFIHDWIAKAAPIFGKPLSEQVIEALKIKNAITVNLFTDIVEVSSSQAGGPMGYSETTIAIERKDVTYDTTQIEF
jgi:hypothetical protein